MEYSLETEIEKPCDEVAALYGDPSNYPYWQPGYLGREEVDGSIVLKYQHGKRMIEMAAEVTSDNLPDEHTIVYVTPGMTMKVQSFFEDLGHGRTKLTTRNTCTASGLIKIIMFFMPGCAKKQSQCYLDNFKAFAEEGKDVREVGG